MGKAKDRKKSEAYQKQIEKHRQKLERAKQDGRLELATYYVKEINRLEKRKGTYDRRQLPRDKRKRQKS